MRKVVLLFSLIAVMASCKSKKSAANANKPKPVEVATDARVPLDELDADQKKRSYEFGHRILNACNTSRFKPFNSSEATPSVIKNVTESKITKTCHQFRLKYGEFREMTLVEVVRNKKDETNVYRYKAEYSKKIANKELRVIMNDDNKLVAIKSTDWVDKYDPIKN
ncbi:hypothetical protein [Flavobacterium sp.]|uniref:hypothetical protein n=1 Tax=Flavobacterium sp. TaxID=239 RepID=UPI0012103CA6|nr:hypothetical protein [Flavobacterium sp.]RZJ70116.1 MAG: hypothetical protein EOO49_14910 [Flavobacterium sp.]